MRKILITFILSVVLIISGSLILAMEINQISYEINIRPTEQTTFSFTVPASISKVEIDPYPSNYSGQVEIESLEIDEFHEDNDLDSNQIMIEYPDFMEIDRYEDQNDSGYDTPSVHTRSVISFHYYLNNDKNVFRQAQSFEELLKIWKNKEATIEEYETDDLKIAIRYGSDLDGKINILT